MAERATLEDLIADRLGLNTEASDGDAKETLLERALDPARDPDLQALLKALEQRFGSSMKAVLLYGSYTRGARDSLVDLYVLLDGYPPVVPRWQALANKLLPPNVYQLEADTGVRCKYALLPLRQFVRRLEHDFHSYFWARFAQPCQVLLVSDGVTRSTLVAGVAAGVRRFLTEAARVVPAPSAPLDLWRYGLQHTYRCELRAESGTRADSLVNAHADYFAALSVAWAHEQTSEQEAGVSRSSVVQEHTPDADVLSYREYSGGSWRWPLRRWFGKVLSVLRLVKAAFTFNDGFAYLLWKIERHSGIYLEPTPSQRRFPLLLGWPLFYRLYRLGAFR